MTIIDVRGAGLFETSHIPGAINIPEADVKSRAGELPKDRLIVTYCT